MWKKSLLSLSLASMAGTSWAQEIPILNQDPKVEKSMSPSTFKFVSEVLRTDKLSSDLRCTLKSRSSRTLRKFHDGSQWQEQIDLTFSSNGFDSGMSMKMVIPENAKYGAQRGPEGEQFRIEVGDAYGHWLQFTHDGRGQVVGITMGDVFRLVPCLYK